MKKTKKNRVVIHVEGGVVQEVYSNDPDIDIELIDFDNMEAEGHSSKFRDVEFKRAIKGLKCVF